MADPSCTAARPLLHEVVVRNARVCGTVLPLLLVGLGCIVFLSFALSTKSAYPMVEKPGIAMASKLRLGVRGRWPLGPERTWRTRDLTQQLVPGLPWNGLLHARSGNMKKLPVAYAKSSEVAIAHGPAKVYSVQAQMVLNLFRENFDLCHEIVQQQLEVLRDQREEEKRFNWRLLEKTSDVDAVVLCKRMSEVQVSARARVVAELLYLKVCIKFKEFNVSLLPSYKKGHIQFGGIHSKGLLPTQMFTQDAVELVQGQLFRIIRQTWNDQPFNSHTAKMSLCEASQIYTMFCHLGYVLRNADQRIRLEKLVSEGDVSRTPFKSLRNYISLFESEQLQHMLSVTSLEAQMAIELQVNALFGNFSALGDKFVNVLDADVTSRRQARCQLMQAVTDHKVKSIFITDHDLERFVFEAVAYGLLLNDATKQVHDIYELTPAKPVQSDPLFPDLDGDLRPPFLA